MVIDMETMGSTMASSTAHHVQGLIKALQMGGSRSKMEAAIALRSFAASRSLHQVALIAAGGIKPLVDLLSYEAKEMQWPPDMRQKATITVRAEAALALASLSLSNDENKAVIGSTGAIPLLCDLIKFGEESYSSNLTMEKSHRQQIEPFLILARDAGVGALSCLAKNEANKSAIVGANAVALLVRMLDQGTSFGKAAAANVLAKLAKGDNLRNKFMVEKEGAIPALVRLIKQGSSKARESAAEAIANLATKSWHKSMIVKEDGVGCLLKMMESPVRAERDAAVMALKVLQLPTGTAVNIKPCCPRDYSTEQHRANTSTAVNAAGQKAAVAVAQETTKFVACHNRRRRFMTSNTSTDTKTCATESSSTESPLSSKMQTLFASELTSSLAPPLLGQPSMQADAILGGHSNGTTASYVEQSCRKRLKVSHRLPGSSTTTTTTTRQFFQTFEHAQQISNNNVCNEAKIMDSQIHLHLSSNTKDSLPSGHPDAGKEEPTNVSTFGTEGAKKIGSSVTVSKFAGRASNGAAESFCKHEDLSSKQGSVSARGTAEVPSTNTTQFGDLNRGRGGPADPGIFSGISALVDALSSQNVGAQEFAALALMLLASQGGNEVKTIIVDAGALRPLISMARSSSSPVIRESAASAIAKLVACHPANRAILVRKRGVQALVEMAKWSAATLCDGGSGIPKAGGGSREGSNTMGARLQAAAIVAILSTSEVLDKQSMGFSMRHAFLSFVHMLESENPRKVEAGIGGLHALGLSLGLDPSHGRGQFSRSHLKDTPSQSQDKGPGPWAQARKCDGIAAELVTSLLNLMQGSSTEAHEAAIESLASFRNYNPTSYNPAAGSCGCSVFLDSAAAIKLSRDPDPDPDRLGALRKEGLEASLLLLEKGGAVNAGVREMVADTLAYVVDSEKLHNYLVEPLFLHHLMSLLRDEAASTMTKILAAAVIANFGAKQKRLDTISADDFTVLLKLLLGSESEDQSSMVAAAAPDVDVFDSSRIYNNEIPPHVSSSCCSSQLQSSYAQPASASGSQLLKEHVAAILVYSALAGEEKKQALIAAGAVPVFVQTLQGPAVVQGSHGNSMILPHLCQYPNYFLPAFSTSRQLQLPCPRATQEFAIMGLILLADKNIQTMEKIVKASGIPTLVKLLAVVNGRGRLGASWSEMAAVALLTLARCDSARDEIVRVGGVTAVVHVLKGDYGPSMISLTGLAAMAQLLGILALSNSPETKVQMAKTGAVRCLVEILVGGGCLAWATEREGCSGEGLGLLALAQEAAAAALATVVLQCPENAEAAVEAGAIGPLVRLLGSHARVEGPGVEERGPENSESGGSSSTTTELARHNPVNKKLRNSVGALNGENDLDNKGGELSTMGLGAPLAALSALGNLLPCFPRCGQEIIDAGGSAKLISFMLHAHEKKNLVDPHIHNFDYKQPKHGTSMLPRHPCYPKLLGSAAAVLGLLAEANSVVREAVMCAGVLPILTELFPATTLDTTSVCSRSSFT